MTLTAGGEKNGTEPAADGEMNEKLRWDLWEKKKNKKKATEDQAMGKKQEINRDQMGTHGSLFRGSRTGGRREKRAEMGDGRESCDDDQCNQCCRLVIERGMKK